MPPDTSHGLLLDKLSSSPTDRYKNSQYNVSHGQRKQSEPHNILEHIYNCLPQCVKQVSKATTTYRDHYCGKKCIPKSQSICLPNAAIQTSEEKMFSRSTYKDDFHAYSRKDQDANRGVIAAQRNNLVCGKQQFSGKSETRFAFKPPYSSKIISWKGLTPLPKDIKGTMYEQRFSPATTYSFDYKRPKINQKTVLTKPRHHVSVSKDPFRHISQYMNDYTKPKREISGRRSKKHSYIPPIIPMEGITTYKESFTLKYPLSGPRMRLQSDRRCKECKISSASDLKKTGNVKIAYEFSVAECGDDNQVSETADRGIKCRQKLRVACKNRHPDKICEDGSLRIRRNAQESLQSCPLLCYRTAKQQRNTETVKSTCN